MTPGPSAPPAPLPRSAAGGTGASRRAAQAAARRHSRVVRSLKFVLPAVALLGAGLLGGQAFLYRWAPNLELPTVLFSKDGLTMVEPHLTGRSRDRAYEVNAQRAVQALDDPKRVRLEKIDARIELADKQWAKVEARAGLYDGTREQLGLEQGLVVTTSNGYRAVTDGADFDLKSGRMVSRAPIRIVGPAADIEAGRLEITDNGRSFLFTGAVRMELRPAAASPPPAAAGPTAATAAAERLAGSNGTSAPLPR